MMEVLTRLADSLPFDPLYALIATPACAALLLALIPHFRLSAAINILASLASFAVALSLLGRRPQAGAYLMADELSTLFLVIGSFVTLTTSIYSASYIGFELRTGRFKTSYLRFYHAMFQALAFAMTLALTANSIGLMWVAIELGTLATVMVVGSYRTEAGLEAAWKYFILGSVAIALALFGTILVYMAARPVIGEGNEAMQWTALMSKAKDFRPELLNIAFVFLILGYGTKVGLAPLHAWLPDAHSEGPTPIAAVLSGLLLNVALYAVLRYKMLMTANPASLAPGPLMVTLGLLSLLFAALMLYRRRDVKRLFAYSSIEHMGIITFAFGLGGAMVNFGALLHVVMHSLIKSAVFFVVGQIAQAQGTQRMDEIGGLTESHPALGWSLVASVIALAGLPPFGMFMSEFVIVSSVFARQPMLAVALVAGLLLAFGALMMKLTGLAFGKPGGKAGPVSIAAVPIAVHLLLALTAGLWLPPPVAAWLQAIAEKLG